MAVQPWQPLALSNIPLARVSRDPLRPLRGRLAGLGLPSRPRWTRDQLDGTNSAQRRCRLDRTRHCVCDRRPPRTSPAAGGRSFPVSPGPRSGEGASTLGARRGCVVSGLGPAGKGSSSAAGPRGGGGCASDAMPVGWSTQRAYSTSLPLTRRIVSSLPSRRLLPVRSPRAAADALQTSRRARE
jgi:hypothetical protein